MRLHGTVIFDQQCCLCFCCGLGDHIFEQNFKRHGVGTMLVREKKLAVTLKNSVVEFHCVRIVVSIKGKLKTFELKPFTFLCIVLGFLNLADHPIVHDFVSFSKDVPTTCGRRHHTKRHACARVPLSGQTIYSWRLILA